jgi:hypothetical protein
MLDDLISVIDVANRLGIRKQTVFKVMKRLGVSAVKLRSAGHKNQMISYVTTRESELIEQDIVNSASSSTVDSTLPATTESGVFYLVQLEPEHDPGRFKVGFATNLQERMRTHRCSAPFVTVVGTWPCLERWEKTAIDCVTQDCERLHTEVFRSTDFEQVVKRCEHFFIQMPRVNNGTA